MERTHTGQRGRGRIRGVSISVEEGLPVLNRVPRMTNAPPCFVFELFTMTDVSRSHSGPRKVCVSVSTTLVCTFIVSVIFSS